MVCSVQTGLEPCTDTNTISKWTKTRFHTTHVTYEFHRAHPKLFMTYGTFNANCAPIFCSTVYKRTKQISTRPSSPRSIAGASKTIYEARVRLTQTEHLSSTALYPKGPNRSPQDPHQLGVPRVHLKWFMNLWCV
jgi:hypothetical protein